MNCTVIFYTIIDYFKFLSFCCYSMKLPKSEIVLGKIILEIWFGRPTCSESFTNLIYREKMSGYNSIDQEI